MKNSTIPPGQPTGRHSPENLIQIGPRERTPEPRYRLVVAIAIIAIALALIVASAAVMIIFAEAPKRYDVAREIFSCIFPFSSTLITGVIAFYFGRAARGG